MIRKDLDTVARSISFNELHLGNGYDQSVAVLMSRDDHAKLVELWAENGSEWGLIYAQNRR
jgi:hypothetical protein